MAPCSRWRRSASRPARTRACVIREVSHPGLTPQASEAQLALAQTLEVTLHLGLAHLKERGEPPARLLVLVDQHRAHAFVEVVVREHVHHHPVLERERILDLETPPPLQDPERELQAERGRSLHRGQRLLRPLPRLVPERGDDGLDRVLAETAGEAIVAALRNEPGEWAKEALAAMERASPLSLKLAFRILQRGRCLEIEDALTLEYRVMMHVLADDDFYEGVRAVLIDKDQKPRWRFGSLGQVSESEVERHFEGLGERELRL